MPKVIKNSQIEQDSWQQAEEDATAQSIIAQAGYWLLPLKLFNEVVETGGYDSARYGLVLESSDSLAEIDGALAEIPAIALRFTSFMDGRSFSQARSLRDEHDYTGEIRAIGAYIQDQVFYLSRCGVNVFELAEEADTDSYMARFSDFSEHYQAACDEPQPLFRRR